MGIIGRGTKVQLGSETSTSATAATAYTDIAEIVDVNGPNIEVNDIEMTNADSPGNFEQYEPGTNNPGEVEVVANYTKAQYSTSMGLIGTKRRWRLLFTDNSNLLYDGYIKGLGTAAPLKDKVSATTTIKIASQPTFATATS
jgi:hypothetical protein